MICTAPVQKIGKKGVAFLINCRKCMSCKINRKSELTARILLEQMTNEKAMFVTLTYEDENLPGIDKYENGNLLKSDVQKFLKRLRYHLGVEHPIRHYLVGEYGTKTERAHYHAIIFNLDFDNPENHTLVAKSWGLGHTYIGDVTPNSAAYVANYTTKKITGSPAGNHYGGRLPEFILVSKHPGLGHDAALLIADALCNKPSRNFLFDNLIRLQGRTYPVDKYIQEIISKRIYNLTQKDLVKTRGLQLDVDEIFAKRKKAKNKQRKNLKHFKEPKI